MKRTLKKQREGHILSKQKPRKFFYNEHFSKKKNFSKYGHRRMWTPGMGPIVLMRTHPLPTKHNNNANSNKTRKHLKLLLGRFHLNILPHAPQTRYVRDRTQCLLPGAFLPYPLLEFIYFFINQLTYNVMLVPLLQFEHSSTAVFTRDGCTLELETHKLYANV